MQRSIKITQIRRTRRKRHVRKKVAGSADRPRLSVQRSCKQIYVQAIDDFNGVTLVSSSSLAKDLKPKLDGDKTEVATAVGADIARLLNEKGVTRVVFDRGWYKFHGRVKALAEGARKAGLEF
jgi:large subunit ribosomal protein L18